MTDIVTGYLNGNILFDPNIQSDNNVDNKNDNNNLMKRTHYWKSFISEIKNLGNINFQITKQNSYITTIKREVENLNSQRQKLNEQISLSGQILNSLSIQISYLMGSLKQIVVSATGLNKMVIIYQPHFYFYFAKGINGKDNDHDDTMKKDEGKDGEGKNEPNYSG